MHDPKQGTTTRPFNAFSQEFLSLSGELEEPSAGGEAETAGPWRVLPYPTPLWPEAHGIWPFGERPERGDPAAALCQDRATALLAAVVRPLAGREPFYRLDKEPWQGGYPLLRHGEPQAWLGLFDEDWASGIGLLERLARSPEGVASLLEAAGPICWRRAGAILLERLLAARR